jgi:exodeoxyribonuclease VII small subunit
MSFESKLEKSKEILDKLMDPEITLEESVKAYDKGMKELQAAQKLLEDAELKIETIKQNSSSS